MTARLVQAMPCCTRCANYRDVWTFSNAQPCRKINSGSINQARALCGGSKFVALQSRGAKA